MVNKNKKIKLIATLGPSSLNKKVLDKLKKDVDIFRLNMSHLSLEQLKKNLKFIKKNNIKNICIDTEGAQIRTISTTKRRYLKKNQSVMISSLSNKLQNYINLYPNFSLKSIKVS